MPRYFFDTFDNGRQVTDDSGLELDGHDALRRAAIGALPHMALDALPDGTAHEFAVVVRDEAGGSLFRATLSFRSEWSGGKQR